MILKKALLSAALLLGASSAASATTVWATSVTDGITSCSVQTNNGNRANMCNALGAADGDFSGGKGNGFTSSGKFTSLTFDFGTKFTGPVTFYEITGGSPTKHPEALTFSAVSVGGAIATGTVANTDPGATKVAGTDARWQIVFNGFDGRKFTSLTVTDNSNTADGFDIDAVSVIATMPLPAGAMLLLTGFGALAVARRRQKGASSEV